MLDDILDLLKERHYTLSDMLMRFQSYGYRYDEIKIAYDLAMDIKGE